MCVALCIAQVLVNLAASHRFDPFSPGILTLLGCLAITSPCGFESAAPLAGELD